MTVVGSKHRKSGVKAGRAVPEICLRTDGQTDRQTDRHTYTSRYRAPYLAEVIAVMHRDRC